MAKKPIPETILNRKGARRVAEVPAEVLRRLQTGEIESVNLTECLAIDLPTLLANTFNKFPKSKIKALNSEKSKTWPNMTRSCAKALFEVYGVDCLDVLLSHTSDNVRGWAAGVIALSDWSLAEKLEQVKPIANDHNSGTRETAWLLLRDRIAEDLETAIELLSQWSSSEFENLRRYASEATRPRGVWCKHIPQLKKQPELGLPILEPLKSDPSRYVQNSVANWLNDAGKSQGPWVLEITKRWNKQSKTKATKYICKRATRNL